MTAEIITIGDEILLGQIIDSNSAHIAKELDGIGISVYQISSIQDEKQHVLKALDEASGRAQVIVITGGLGPTKDDVTKYSLCEYFSDQLVLNNEVLAHIERLFSKFEKSPLSQLNKEQAMVPSKARVLHNEFGTAPGLWLEKNNRVYIAMPGVPYEMRNLMEKQVIPGLREKFSRPFTHHKHVLVTGIPESVIAEKLEDFEASLPSFLKLAYLPNLGTVRLRISGKGEDETQLIQEVQKQIDQLFLILKGNISIEQGEDEKIVVQINQILTKRKQFLTSAESCTGGALAAAFTTHPGASSCFKGGIVTYATSSKSDVLKVPEDIIEKHSVVSAQVVEKMAENAREMFQTDYALATTGNAGPTKGDSEAEVGTVFIGLATPEKTISRKFIFGNNRDQVVSSTVNKAFEMILKEIAEL